MAGCAPAIAAPAARTRCCHRASLLPSSRAAARSNRAARQASAVAPAVRSLASASAQRRMSSESGTLTAIVAVGRELLTGRTVDSNSASIAARLVALGAWVERIVAVDDDLAAVAREVGGARQRGASLVVTSGGLGPTFDDRTLAGVAAALGRPLVEHPATLAAARAMEVVPGVYLKSLPTQFAPGCDLRVRISARGPDRTEVEARVAHAAAVLAAELGRHGRIR